MTSIFIITIVYIIIFIKYKKDRKNLIIKQNKIYKQLIEKKPSSNISMNNLNK